MDQENLKQIADEVISVVAKNAGKAAEVAGKAASELSAKAAQLSKTGVEAATPVVHQLADVAQDRAKSMLESSKVGADQAVGAGLAALVALAAKGQETLADVEKQARAAQTPKVVKKRGRAGRVLGFGAAAAGIASVSYLLWRRSRPIEDPWAEEYWVDLQNDGDIDEVPVEPVEASVPEVQDEAEEANS